MRTWIMFLMIWYGRPNLPLIEEVYPPVVLTMTSWSKQSCMKSADQETSAPSSARKTDHVYPLWQEKLMKVLMSWSGGCFNIVGYTNRWLVVASSMVRAEVNFYTISC